MANRQLLIIDDEEGVRTSLSLLLADEGFSVETAPGADEALRLCAQRSFDVILCDVRMPGRDGLSLLPELRVSQADATLLMMSAFDDVGQALEAVRRGADDYLAKPFQLEELLLAIGKTEERERLRRENQRLRRELGEGRPPSPLVVVSDGMRDVWELVERAAEFTTTVLITGESGSGKEVVARSIHERCERADQPFLAINCGAIPESLIESELFGHSRGAFTGADAARPGLFREADGGTVFLDEIGELPAHIQVKLLRVLQEQEVRPVGEPRSVPIDVRIVAATARDLAGEVAAGRFRDDLYYRLNVLQIHVPPLRDRPDDIPVLAEQLLRNLSRRVGKRVEPLVPDVLDLLAGYPWPGNVRELENTLERALILTRDGRLTRNLFPFADQVKTEAEASAPEGSLEDLSIKRRTRALEERLIRLALEHTGGNRTRAARILQIDWALGCARSRSLPPPLWPSRAAGPSLRRRMRPSTRPPHSRTGPPVWSRSSSLHRTRRARTFWSSRSRRATRSGTRSRSRWSGSGTGSPSPAGPTCSFLPTSFSRETRSMR
jgi:two-component system response regulator AtoC